MLMKVLPLPPYSVCIALLVVGKVAETVHPLTTNWPAELITRLVASSWSAPPRKLEYSSAVALFPSEMLRWATNASPSPRYAGWWLFPLIGRL